MAVTTPTKTRVTDKPIAPKVRQMVTMLVVEFLAGMGLNLIGQPDSGSTIVKRLAYGGIAFVHVVNGLGLLIIAAWLFKLSFSASESYQKLKLQIGFAGVLLAFVSGVLTGAVKSLSGLFSFLMATFFLLALLAYNSLYTILTAKSKPSA